MSRSPEEGRVSLAVESVKSLRPEIAIVLCAWRREGQNDREIRHGETPGGRVTIVLDHGKEGWRIVALQNTDRKE